MQRRRLLTELARRPLFAGRFDGRVRRRSVAGRGNRRHERCVMPPVGIATDMRPGCGADLRDGFSIDDRFQGDDDFAVDPALEAQTAQPTQLAGWAQIDPRRVSFSRSMG